MSKLIQFNTQKQIGEIGLHFRNSVIIFGSSANFPTKFPDSFVQFPKFRVFWPSARGVYLTMLKSYNRIYIRFFFTKTKPSSSFKVKLFLRCAATGQWYLVDTLRDYIFLAISFFFVTLAFDICPLKYCWGMLFEN